MEGAGPLGILLGQAGSLLLAAALMFGGPVLYLWLQARALWRWSGAWRLAALPPLLLMGAATAYTAQEMRAGSNLAPIIVVFMLPVAILWLVAAGWARSRALR